MALRPLHDHILVKRLETEKVTAGGIILPDSVQEKSSEGEVIAVGNGTKAEDGTVTPLDVVVGDTVLLKKWGGNEVKIDGVEMLIITESDVMGIIE